MRAAERLRQHEVGGGVKRWMHAHFLALRHGRDCPLARYNADRLDALYAALEGAYESVGLSVPDGVIPERRQARALRPVRGCGEEAG